MPSYLMWKKIAMSAVWVILMHSNQQLCTELWFCGIQIYSDCAWTCQEPNCCSNHHSYTSPHDFIYVFLSVRLQKCQLNAPNNTHLKCFVLLFFQQHWFVCLWVSNLHCTCLANLTEVWVCHISQMAAGCRVWISGLSSQTLRLAWQISDNDKGLAVQAKFTNVFSNALD